MRKVIRTPSYDLAQRPFMIIWEVTQACDLACRHCRAEAMPRHHPQMLSTDEGKDLLRQVKEFGTPRPILVFTGGDPFKRADLFELLKFGNELGLVMAVSPSGTPLLTQERLQRMKDCGVKAISLSIDGSGPELHDGFRGVEGSFDLTMKGWQAANDVGLKVQINTTVTRYNLLDLPAVFELITRKRVMTWSVFFLVPVGRGKSEDNISPSEYEAVMHFLYDCSKFVSVKTTEGHHYKRVVVQRTILDEKGDDSYTQHVDPVYFELRKMLESIVKRGQLEPRSTMRRSPLHINAGKGFVFISHLGEVQPSGFFPVTVGNVRRRTLQELYQGAPLMRSLRNEDVLQGRCGLCEFQKVCGGSRSRAYATQGDPFAEEQSCSYAPGSFPYQDELRAYIEKSE